MDNLLVLMLILGPLNHGAQLLDVLYGVLEDVHLAHLLCLRGRGHVQPEMLVALVDGLHPRPLPRVPPRHSGWEGWGDGVAQGGMEYHSSTARQCPNNSSILHLLRRQRLLSSRSVSVDVFGLVASFVSWWVAARRFRWLVSLEARTFLPARLPARD